MLKIDCRYFQGDRPCKFHKETGVKCPDCNHYSPIEYKILIIKLDAIGDVLRTTAILPALKEQYPDSHITWCTKKNAKDIFTKNHFVDDVIFIEEDAFYRMSIEEYDYVINLDTSKLSSAIASLSISSKKVGFILNSKGYVEPTSKAAQTWLLMSAFDDVKFANEKSYQQLMYEILELKSKISPPILILNDDNKALYSKFDLNNQKLTIGFNTGVGTKWPNKGWSTEKWDGLFNSLKNHDLNLLLLGGPEEKEKNKFFISKYDFLIDTGCDNSILDFVSIVNLCDILITADTFALHIATALEKFIIVLFGPTSATEIELYGKGVKLLGTKRCKCFYQRKCSEEYSCMDSIEHEIVYTEIMCLKELLGK